MSDTIYRQDAIDALNKHIDTFDAIDKNYLCGLRTAMSILKEMPSAQPETQINTLDCVSRQAAMVVFENSGLDDDSKDTVVRVLEQLPSAQPELFEHEAYIRGFEQGRTQGMIDSQGGKK